MDFNETLNVWFVNCLMYNTRKLENIMNERMALKL